MGERKGIGEERGRRMRRRGRIGREEERKGGREENRREEYSIRYNV